MAGTRLFNDIVAFIQSLPDAKYLKPTDERMRDEIAAALGARDADPFLSPEIARTLVDDVFRTPAVWEAEKQNLARQKASFEHAETLARNSMRDRVGGQRTLAQGAMAWFANRESRIEDWGKDTLRRFREDMRLPKDEREWPDVRRLPTVWAMTSFRLARMYLVLRDGRKIDANDFPDWGHYVGAIHAESIVSDDAKFRSIIEECPAPKPVARSFADWASDLLA